MGRSRRLIRDEGLVAFDHLLDHLQRLVGGDWRIDAQLDPDRHGIVAELDEGLHLIGEGIPSEHEELARSVVEACAPLARHALQIGRQASQAQAEASIDPLTGLVNRRGWQHGLAREDAHCAREKLAAVVGIIDIDELKAVNDCYGHLCGDLIIVLVAEALRAVCRPEDIIARLGGDEFGVVIVGQAVGQQHLIANRLLASLMESGVAASIGTTEVAGVPLAEAVALADRAMYRRKGIRRRARERRRNDGPAGPGGQAGSTTVAPAASPHAAVREQDLTGPPAIGVQAGDAMLGSTHR